MAWRLIRGEAGIDAGGASNSDKNEDVSGIVVISQLIFYFLVLSHLDITFDIVWRVLLEMRLILDFFIHFFYAFASFNILLLVNFVL